MTKAKLLKSLEGIKPDEQIFLRTNSGRVIEFEIKKENIAQSQKHDWRWVSKHGQSQAWLIAEKS